MADILHPCIEPDRCKGCGRCVAACSLHLLTLEPVGSRKTATLTEPEHCTGCGACLEACPYGAIHLP